jgi:hypothetical protein
MDVGHSLSVQAFDRNFVHLRYHMALLKTFAFLDQRSLEMRFETFNIFNHKRFDGASSVNGNFTSSSFRVRFGWTLRVQSYWCRP